MSDQAVPVFLHIPKCAGTYVIGWNMLMMRYYGILNKWNEQPGWNGTLKIVDVVERDGIVMRAFVWLKRECPWRAVGANGAVASMEELKRELPSCGVLFSIVVESCGFKLLRQGVYEEVCAVVGRGPAYYTILRESLDREAALYDYLTAQRSLHEPTHGNVVSKTFSEYIFNELSDNWITRALAGVNDDGTIEDADVAYVEDFLNKSIVGAMGDVDSVLSKVFRLCYGVIVNDVPREWVKDVNANSGNKESISELGDYEMEAFNHRTQHDAYLYAKFSKPKPFKKGKIYTYFDDIHFSGQEELLQLWMKSWQENGFEPHVLTRADAIKSAYFDEYMSGLQQAHFYITGKSLTAYGEACYLRWLAYSEQGGDGSFFVSDYDVINNGFQGVDESEARLNHLGGRCPCIASGTPNQYLNFCMDMVGLSLREKERIKEEYNAKGGRWYHDQEFLWINKGRIEGFYNIVSNIRYVTQYEYGKTDLSKANLIHVAHASVESAQNQFPDLQGQDGDELRVNFVKRIIGWKYE